MTPGPGWPYGLLDLAALRAQGWRPVPLREFVLKVHQRCNLACDYCYVYTMADQSWRDRPKTMSSEVWQAAARRIAEHVAAHELDGITVVLHGGEPLLAGTRRLAALLDDVRSTVPASCRIRFVLQTNGLLIDPPMLDALQRYGVQVGVSLDGAPGANDRHRTRPDGRGSHRGVHAGLRLLTSARYRGCFAGLLCTVDATTDPVACYQSLLRYSPPRIEFLLPHANWSQPPHRTVAQGPAPYGDWLVRAFDRWYGAPKQEVRVRLFEDAISLALGGAGSSEQIGLSPVAAVVVETDGAIEQIDSLKSAYPGACATGLSVHTDPFEAALSHPGVVARQIGRQALCEDCLACPVHRICGAGHYAHRYRAGAGFRNPTVYCPDMLVLIGHVRSRLRTDLSRLGVRSGV